MDKNKNTKQKHDKIKKKKNNMHNKLELRFQNHTFILKKRNKFFQIHVPYVSQIY